MQTYVLALTTSVFILVHGVVAATAQGPMMPQPNQQQSQRQPEAQEGTGMGQEAMMRMIFSLMDSDGDGTISLPEFQAAHERIFKGMDSNKDGRLTLEEIQGFMHGTGTPVR
jgi:Ca2+-binding EF-hand superfamily protein